MCTCTGSIHSSKGSVPLFANDESLMTNNLLKEIITKSEMDWDPQLNFY